MAGKKLTQEQMLKLGYYIRNNPPEQVKRSGLLGKGEGLVSTALGPVATAMSILEQPKNAISTAWHYSMDKDPKTNMLAGFVQGLKGDVHTSYSQIAEDYGIHNKLLKGLLGFAGDVAFDPLTYTGVGLEAGLTRGAAELAAGKTLAEEAIAKGGYEGVANAESAVTKKALTDRTTQMLADNPSKLQFRFGLPTATPVTHDVTIPQGVRDVVSSAVGPDTKVGSLAKYFSRRAEQPYGMAELGRVAEGSANADFGEQYGVLRRTYAKMSEPDRNLAALRYMYPGEYPGVGGQALEQMPISRFARDKTPLSEQGLNNIDDVVNLTKDVHRKILSAELDAGHHLDLLPSILGTVEHEGVPYLENQRIDWQHLNERMKGDVLDKAMARDKLRRIVLNPDHLDTIPGLSRSRKIQDRYIDLNKQDPRLLPEASKPVIDIGESTLQRLRDTYKLQTQADFTRQAIEKFGINTKELEGADKVMANLRASDVNGKLNFRPLQPAKGSNLLFNDVAKLRQYKDTYLPEDIASILNATHSAVTDETAGRAVLRQYDRFMTHWKAANSLVNPGYLSRTSIGDFIQNAVGGVWDPRRYTQAMSVLKDASTGRTENILSALRNPDLPLNALKDGNESQFAVSIGGELMKSDKINGYFHTSGAKSGELVTESLPGVSPNVGEKASNVRNALSTTMTSGETGPIGRVGEKVGGAVNQFEAKMADANVWRETHLRMANFINHMDHGVTSALQDEAKAMHMSTKDLSAIRETLGPRRVAKIEQDAAMAAGKHVRKYNIDYGMLSTFEKDVMRRVVPFYSWFRLNAPRQLEQLATHPGVMTMTPKLINSVQEMLGTADAKGDFMLPDWIRESMPFRLAEGGAAASNPVSLLARKLSGAKGDEAVFMPSLMGLSPMQDLNTILNPISRAYDVSQMREGGLTNWHNWAPTAWEGIGQATSNAFNMATPAIKAPAERAIGRSFYTGQKITNWNDWLLGQTIPGKQLSRGIGVSDQPALSGLTSALIGLQLQPVTQARQKGEFRRRSDVLNPEIQRLKAALGKKTGVPQESRFYQKLTDSQIQEYKNYLKLAGKAVGST